jgi:hypothetical protein
VFSAITSFLSNFAAACAQPSFFTLPTWYKYVPLKNDAFGNCKPDFRFRDAAGNLNLNDLLLVGMGIIDILLRLAALVAVGFIMYAGLQYITAQGEPDKAKKALGTIINAFVGLGITIVAAASVAFIALRVGG